MPPRLPNPFPVTTSIPLAQSLITDLLIPHYALSPNSTCQFHNFGLNDTFIITSATQKFALRIYRHNWRSSADISHELDALTHLASRGIPVSTSIPRTDHTRISTLPTPEGDRPVVLFTFAPGTQLKSDDTDSTDFGRSCAQLHTATDNFTSQHPRFKLDLAHLLDQPLATIRPHLAHRPKDWDYLHSLAARLRESIEKLDPASLDQGFCHGDFHGGNVHRDADRLTHFDFDCSGTGWRAYDIAVYRWASRLGTKDSEQKRWQAFLAGYRSARPLSPEDLAATDLFIPIREIWLLGTHLHGGPRWGFGGLGDKYFDHHLKLLHEMQSQFLDAPPLFANPTVPAA